MAIEEHLATSTESGVAERGGVSRRVPTSRAAGLALDARTPAVWISSGTGHDGAHNRNAPKVGWSWAGNRHTWLGFASAARRSA